MKIAIASGKGGTGKTSLAVNLAHKAAFSHSTLLLDLDVEEPNCSLFMPDASFETSQLFRKVPVWDKELCTTCGKCISWCKFNALVQLLDEILVLPELCHSCFACSELCPVGALPMQDMPLGSFSRFKMDKLDFVEAKQEIGLQQAPSLIEQSLKLATGLYPDKELIFLDCPPGTSCPVIAATKTADFVILITEPSRFGIWDLSLAVETMRALGKDFAVVVNRFGPGDKAILDYLEQEKIELLATIPNMRKVAELYSAGQLIYDKVPELDAALATILEKLEKLR